MNITRDQLPAGHTMMTSLRQVLPEHLLQFRHENHSRHDAAEIEKEFVTRLMSYECKQLKAYSLLEHYRGKNPLKKPLIFTLGICRRCGEPLRYSTTDGARWEAVSPCPAADLSPIRAEIDVPSGELLFFHDLRPFLSPEPEGGWESVERRQLRTRSPLSLVGIGLLLRLYSLEGVLRLPIRAHASLLPSNDDHWTILNPGIELHGKRTSKRRPVISGHNTLMCCDGGLVNLFPAALHDAVRVPCAPGRYRLTVNSNHYEGDSSRPLVYAALERVGDY